VKSILFVDDEQNVLHGLRNALRNKRTKWDMVFACGGEAAVTLLGQRAFDVVISDMRMPRMDGTALLTKVKQMQPHAVRMILSGQTEAEAAMRSVFLAHRFLAKPCDPDLLERVIDRACALHDLLHDEGLRAAAGNVSMLPAAPKVFASLSTVLANPRTTLKDVAKVIESDTGLSAKILQLVNSAFFGLPRRVSRISEAVVCLGIATVKDVAVAIETYSRASAVSASEVAAVQGHSFLVADLARQICKQDRVRAEEAFVTGLLHDVGKLFPLQETNEDMTPLLGAYLLGLWGLPHPIIEAIAYHHQPERLPHDGIELVDVIYIADHLVNELTGRDQEPLDLAYLATRGVTDEQLVKWRDIAAGRVVVTEAA
jgi:HD-like signal output (HDOD) protein/CheY-like chemotaxis protein